MSQTSKQGVSLATTTPPRKYRVSFQDGSTWEGTKRELFEENPTWWQFAREIQQPVAPVPRDTQEDYSGDVLTQIEQDYADDPHPGRLPSSSRTYMDVPGKKRVRYEFRPDTPIQRRSSLQPDAGSGVRETEDIPQAKPKRQRRGFRAHPLLLLGIGMVIMLALWVLLQMAISWWQVTQDDWHYGRPRTWQTDAVVGHNGDSSANPSHFIFINLNRRVEVIEFPAGDGSKAKIYLGPTLYTDGAELIPVTGEFVDVNGDGRPDMILKIQDQRIVYINTGDSFRPLNPGEHVTLPQN